MAQQEKNLTVMQDTRVWSQGQEGPLEQETATHSSIHAWKIPWRKGQRLRSRETKVQRGYKELDTTEHDDGFEVKVWLWHKVSFDPESTACQLCDPMIFIENPWTLISLSLNGR